VSPLLLACVAEGSGLLRSLGLMLAAGALLALFI